MSKRLAIWDLSFRPFFLLGLLAASSLMAAWLWLLAWAQAFTPYFDPILWHAHEMIYGFAVAIVIGFIFTASQNWTNTPGIKGGRLMLLAIIWIAARFMLAFPIAPPIITAIIDLGFLPLADSFLVPYLGHSKQKHNMIFLVLLALLSLGNLLMHLGALGFLAGYERQGAYLGLHIIILMIIVIGGRVIPFFSERAISGYAKPQLRWSDNAALASSAIFVLASFFSPMSIMTGIFATIAAFVNLRRWLAWLDRRVWRVPILAILYIGYSWVIVGFIMTALANFSVVSLSPATHAFTVGVVGTMIIGMVSRVSLGHTGRTLVASRTTVLAYGLVTMAALIRVFGPLLAPRFIVDLMQASGLLWVSAFALVFVCLVPILISPRPDGRPG